MRYCQRCGKEHAGVTHICPPVESGQPKPFYGIPQPPLPKPGHPFSSNEKEER